MLWKASSMPGTLRLNSVIAPSPCLLCAESSSLAVVVNFYSGFYSGLLHWFIQI